MISSARLRKSENALNHARPYMEQLQNILDHIASEINDYQSPLSQNRPLRRVAIVVFAVDEGLCHLLFQTRFSCRCSYRLASERHIEEDLLL